MDNRDYGIQLHSFLWQLLISAWSQLQCQSFQICFRFVQPIEQVQRRHPAAERLSSGLDSANLNGIKWFNHVALLAFPTVIGPDGFNSFAGVVTFKSIYPPFYSCSKCKSMGESLFGPLLSIMVWPLCQIGFKPSALPGDLKMTSWGNVTAL